MNTIEPRRALATILLLAACGGEPGTDRTSTGPPSTETGHARLVVLVSVDQLRGDYLERHDSLFTGGFRRLLDRGTYFTAATHDHSATETGPGHATLGTGVYPAHSGLPSNEFYVGTGEANRVYVVEDTTARIVGDTSAEGRAPTMLRHTGFADWLMAAHPGAKVLSVAGKDRSAILMLGKAHGQAYWFDSHVGRFVTSDYYVDALPAWLVAVQRDSITSSLLRDSVWREATPPASRGVAGPDSVRWEADTVHTSFPHRYAEEGHDRYWSWLGGTPFIDGAVLQAARAAVRAEGLGADSVPDYLALGMSQTDYVGHSYGPDSREQLDNLLRLDRELGDFFDFLDRRIGPDAYAVVLSADHGVLTMPELRAARGESGRRVLPDEWRTRARAVAAQAAGGPARGDVATDTARQDRVARALERLDWVADAIPAHDLRGGAPADSFVTLFRHSYVPDRPADTFEELYGVAVRRAEGVLITSGHGGTSHGSVYWYDRWVPIVVMGRDVRARRDASRVATVDVAPTLAALTGTPVPDDLDGAALPIRTP